MLIGETHKLGDQEGDRSYDPLFGRGILHIFSWSTLLLNTAFSWRVVSISLNLWKEDTFLKKGISFWSFDPNIFIIFFGIFLFVFGFALRVYSIKTLGSLFTFEVGMRKNHRLITHGPYTLIRHPSYLGYLCLSLGMYFFFATFLGMILTLITCFFFYTQRIPMEEQVLLENFGDEFEQYKKRTKKIIPFIF
jgi:protein-S-isoprenylcysteine O-methyltransferase Ste14